jgi:Ca2+-binding RTX toxin-like protein
MVAAPEASPNVAPEADVAGTNLLGLIGASALNLIDLGTRQAFTASDANNNITTVEITYQAVLGLGSYTLAASQALATELGLKLKIVNNNHQSKLTITSLDGGTIDNLAVNELLGTVHFDQSGIDLQVLNATTITVTDSEGLTATDSLGALAELNLLSTAPAARGIQEGTAADNTLTGSGEEDRLYGHGGDDSLAGEGGNDLLRGGAGNDTLDGGTGNDILIGGAGNDSLTGGLGADVFRWELGDQGSAGSPATDTITDFDMAAPALGGDVLDLRDLLQGEEHFGTDPGNLDSYLHFEHTQSGTVIQVSSSGGFAGGFNAGAVDQTITLQGQWVDLTAGGALSPDQQIIQDLLATGKLITD